ncbi:MAG TPA: hypothetical protein EYQ83_00310 [Acidobacteria bacterium]|nr:hypothetical protein [Acidobacteriota bacterium]
MQPYSPPAVWKLNCRYPLEPTTGGNSTELRAEHVLIATGRRPNTAGLGLESVGVTVDADGAVVIDDHQASSNPRIWAAGEVPGDPQFVDVARRHLRYPAWMRP